MNDYVITPAERDEIHRQAFHRLCKLIALAIFFGLCLIPVVMP